MTLHLTGRHTTLREFRPDDVDAALAIIGDDRVTRWLSFDSRSRMQTQMMIADTLERSRLCPRQEYYLAITRLNDDDLIGFARLGRSGVKAAKLGYALRYDQWRRGYTTDAVHTLVSFGFAGLGLHRVSAAIGPDNRPSLRLVERLGFCYEGLLRDHVHTNGAWRNSMLYSVLAPEWRTNPEGPPVG
jgi:ribosomal-protein-alanine N-acetyltransferase